MIMDKDRKLTQKYIEILCIINNTDMSTISRKLGHSKNYVHGIFDARKMQHPHQHYWDMLGSYFSMNPAILNDVWHGNATHIYVLLASVYEQIHSRCTLLTWLKCVTTFEDTTLSALARQNGYGASYFHEGMTTIAPGKKFKGFLIKIANAIGYTCSKLTRFSHLPIMSKTTPQRKAVYWYCICLAKAVGSSLSQLSRKYYTRNGFGNTLLYGSKHMFQDALQKFSRVIQLPTAVVYNKPYSVVRGIALASVHDRPSLRSCVSTLLYCSHISEASVEHHYGFSPSYICKSIWADHGQSITKLLMQIRPMLHVSKNYITTIIRESNISTTYSTQTTYGLLRAYVTCIYMRQHISIKQMSHHVYHNAFQLIEILNGSYIHSLNILKRDANKLRLSCDAISLLIKGDKQPLKSALNAIRSEVTDRRTLHIYIRCLIRCSGSTLTEASLKLGHGREYISTIINSASYQTISSILSQLAAIFSLNNRDLQRVLRRTNIPSALRYSGGRVYKQYTLDQQSRLHIKQQLFLLIYEQGILPTHLSWHLFPNTTSECRLYSKIMRGSRDTMIMSIAKALTAIKEPAITMRHVLETNHMGLYYPMLRKRMLWIQNKRAY